MQNYLESRFGIDIRAEPFLWAKAGETRSQSILDPIDSQPMFAVATAPYLKVRSRFAAVYLHCFELLKDDVPR